MSYVKEHLATIQWVVFLVESLLKKKKKVGFWSSVSFWRVTEFVEDFALREELPRAPSRPGPG